MILLLLLQVQRVGKCILKNVADNMPGSSKDNKKDVIELTIRVFTESHPEGK